MARSATPKKRCIGCGKVWPITEFIPNRAWAAQQNCDLYCRQCTKAMVFDKDSLRKYMWENNRMYSEKIWEAALKRSKRILANNAEYNRSNISAERKAELEAQVTAQQGLTVMNLMPLYHYNDNADEIGNLDPFNPDSMDGSIVDTMDGEEGLLDSRKYWDPVWNGMYSKRELDYLNHYYEGLQDSFSLDDISSQDYARKVAKASLEADTRYDMMRAGKLDSKAWKEAQDVFDALSKSSALTAAQRKDRGNDTNKVLCEIIQEIEVNHHAMIPQVTFSPDDIDRILEDFRHTDIAIK